MRPDVLAAAIADGPGRRADGRWPSWPPSGPPRRPRSIRSRPSPTSPSGEGLWLHVDAAYAGRGRARSRRARPVRRLGAGGFDRRQPAQVAVHAARRVAAADAADGPTSGRRSASCRSTCARSIARRRSATTTSTRRSSGGGSGRSSCGCMLRWFGSRACGGGSTATSRWRRPSPSGSTPIPTGSAWRRSRSRRSASAGDPPGRGARTSRPPTMLDERNARIMDAVNRTGEVFLSHTRLDGRFTIRLSVGNLRTEPQPCRREPGRSCGSAAAAEQGVDAR